MSSNTPALCWMDGEIMPAAQARIPVLDHGLLYGDGVFEGIRFYQHRAFLLQPHLRRLRDSAQAIALDIKLSDAQLTQAIEELIAAHGEERGYIRLVVTRGVGNLGISPVSCAKPCVFMIADTMEMVTAEQRNQGVRIITASTRRLPNDGLSPRIKSLNYLNHIMARLEAHNANAQEAIVLNSVGNVAEGTTDNVFIVRDGVLITPPVVDGALEGITRNLMLQLAESLGIAFREQSFSQFDMYTADESFLTGTGAELIPVREMDGRKIRHCPGPVFTQLQQAFSEFISK